MAERCVSKSAKSALVGLLLAGTAACTAPDRYYAVRSENLRECDRKLSDVERERCREQLAPASYDEYQRLRATASARAGTERGRRPPKSP